MNLLKRDMFLFFICQFVINFAELSSWTEFSLVCSCSCYHL